MIVLRVLIMIFYLILLVHMYSFLAFLSWIRIRIQIRIYEADPDPDSGKKSDLDPEKTGSETLVLMNKKIMLQNENKLYYP